MFEASPRNIIGSIHTTGQAQRLLKHRAASGFSATTCSAPAATRRATRRETGSEKPLSACWADAGAVWQAPARRCHAFQHGGVTPSSVVVVWLRPIRGRIGTVS